MNENISCNDVHQMGKLHTKYAYISRGMQYALIHYQCGWQLGIPRSLNRWDGADMIPQ